MANGRHFKADTPRVEQPLPATSAARARRRQTAMPKRPIALTVLALALAVVGVAIAGVVAWLTASSSLINEFGLGQVDTSVEETFDGGTAKSDVKAKNNGTVPIYVRAQVNIYWQDANGN